MVLLKFSEEDFLVFGLKKMGFSYIKIGRNVAMNGTRFKDQYGVTPTTCSKLFDDIQNENLGESKVCKPNPLYLLMTLFYLKKSATKCEMAGYINGCENTALRQCKRYLKSIHALLRQQQSKMQLNN